MWMTASIIAAIAAFGSFAWGVKGHFRSNPQMPLKMKLLSLASLCAFMHFMLVAINRESRVPGQLVSILFSAGAAVLFWWAVKATSDRPPSVAHSNEIPNMIYNNGPYRYVRHPFYLSYSLFWAGLAIAVGRWQWLAFIILVTWYYVTAQEEEEHFKRSSVAEAYSDYRTRTGMILPKLNAVLR